MPFDKKTPEAQARLRRKKKLIDPSYQIRYILYLAGIASLECVLVAAIVILTVFGMIDVSPEGHARLFIRTITVLGLALAGLNLLNMLLGLFLSHRISGPLYRLRTSMQKAKAGDFSQVMRLRVSDEFQSLKESFNEMVEGLRDIAIRQRTEGQRLARQLQAMPQLDQPAEAAKLASKLEEITQLYKI
jgi:methyl-accepting chemotaxis protein